MSWSLPPLSSYVALLLGYALGSIPFGLILTRVAGTQDIRTIGSGNIGATNVLRTGHKGLAAATLIGDMLKGTVAVLLAGSLIGENGALPAALGAFLGHLFPVWLGFKGGKGVATFLGVTLALVWQAALVFAAAWLTVAFVTRYSSLAALIASVLTALAAFALAPPPTGFLLAILTALLWFMHRANIGRLLAGTEGKIGKKGQPLAPRGVHLDPGQRRDWLRLIRTENVGPRAFRSLVNRFGGAAAALDALPALARRGGGLIPPRIPSPAEAEAEMAALDRMGGRFIALGEPDYPELLRQIDDAPPLIALRGRAEVLARPTVAIVGSRNASGAGRTMTVRIARGLGAAGWVIASGLARGIDAMAHEASLATGTVAVIAGGHDRPYPRENEPLMERIAAEGAILSEMPMGWEPRARDFPAATGWFPASRSAWWWSRRPSAPAR